MLHLVLIFILGTIVGSFLNVCIHRLPRGGSLVFPASHCPSCQHKLSVLDLIPVFSYFLLRGKCRYCKAPISFRYLIVEFLAGSIFVGIALNFPLSYRLFPFHAIFVGLMIVAFFIDLEHQVIPDAVSFAGIGLGLIYNAFVVKNLLPALLGMFLGYLILFLIGFVGKLIFKKEAMGEGDLFLGALLGAYLGWQNLLLALFLAYLLAAVVSLFLLALGKVKMGEHIPFGPALAAGGVLTLFFGRAILSWYLGLLL